MIIKKGTIRYEVEKIRMQIVEILMAEIRVGKLSRSDLRQIAQDVLRLTDEVKRKMEINHSIIQLHQKHKILTKLPLIK